MDGIVKEEGKRRIGKGRRRRKKRRTEDEIRIDWEEERGEGRSEEEGSINRRREEYSIRYNIIVYV
jgi:hypothetical protein